MSFTSIILSDVHQRVREVKSILEANPNADEYVFLGDFFDSYEEPPVAANFKETCEFLRHLVLEHPLRKKFRFLVGNHDLSYIFHNNNHSHKSIHKSPDYYCSGWTKNKAKTFRKCFWDQGLRDAFFINNFRPAYQTQGFTLSHAGIHTKHIPAMRDMNFLVNDLLPDVWTKFRMMMSHPHNWLLSGAGEARWGPYPVGGVMWLDWRSEFEASEHLGKQVVGHTTVEEPSCVEQGTEWESWNLDTTRHHGVITDGVLTTKTIPGTVDHTTKRHEN